MSDISQQMEDVKEELRKTPHHKATDHYIGHLRAKLSRLKDKHTEMSQKGGGGKGSFTVKKQGHATIVLVGPPSVGKSTLINKLTNAKSKIAPYEFTTVSVIPGMMQYKNANIQILDVPGLIAGAEEGKGRGREVLSVIRGSDLLLIMIEPNKQNSLKNIINALENNGIRINKKRPDVIIDKKISGGIIIHSNIKQEISKETIKDISSEMGIKNAEITIKEKITIDSLIDAFSRNRVYIPAIYLLNKIDTTPQLVNQGIQNDETFYISAKFGTGIDHLKEIIWNKLNFVNIFLVRPNENPSSQNPIISRKDQTLLDVANEIGTDFSQDKTKAIIWGTGAKYPGQEVSLSTKVQNGMQIRFI